LQLLQNTFKKKRKKFDKKEKKNTFIFSLLNKLYYIINIVLRFISLYKISTMNLDLIIFLSLLIFILLFIIAGSLYVMIYDSIYKKDDYHEDTK
jgi:uncharacterized Tic20 family protein